MTTFKIIKKTKTLACATFLLSSLMVFSQTDNSLATNNTFIGGVTVDSFFHQEPDTSSDPTKMTFAVNITDGDDDTDWAGQTSQVGSGEAFNIINLNGEYDLAEIQLLTVTGKAAPYTFDFLVSTTGTADADFTDVFTASEKGTSGFIESHYLEVAGSVLDGTYKSFVLPTVVEGAKYVKVLSYGRTDVGNGGGSVWSTISELKFYAKADATASLIDEELAGADLYPNPVDGVLFLEGISDKVNRLEVLGLGGQVLLTKEIEASSATIDLSGLANGVYFVNFSNTSSNLSGAKTIVVQH